jgi:tricorn protease
MLSNNIADTGKMALSIWPALEYQQMYDGAWKLLDDYFYDPGMNGVDWPEIHSRYRALVKRCARREELETFGANVIGSWCIACVCQWW